MFLPRVVAFLVLFCANNIFVHAQPVVPAFFCGEAPDAGGFDPKWRCLGPEGQPKGKGAHVGNGQMNGVRFDPRYHEGEPGSSGYGRIYAFSPTGGLWRTENEGRQWDVVGAVDTQLPAINVADVAVCRQDPETLFLATGDGDHSYRLVFEPYRGVVVNTMFSSGVYRSRDDGANWERIAMPGSFTCAEPLGMQLVRIESHPRNPEILFALSTHHGLWRTTNALAPASEVVWEQILAEERPFESGSGWRGLVLTPGRPDILYAAGRQIYRSADGGTTWAPLPGMDPDSLFEMKYDDGFCLRARRECPGVYDSLCQDGGKISREFSPMVINLAVTPDDPARLYAYVLAEEVYRKPVLGPGRGEERCRDFGTRERRPVLQIRMWDGKQWHVVQDRAEWGMAASRMALAVSDVDANQIVYGVVNLSGTAAGLTDEEVESGNAFQLLAGSGHQGYHVDVHALAFEPNTNNPRLLVAHDGGLSWGNPDGTFQFSNSGLQTNLIWTFDHFERPGPDLEAVIGTQDCGTMLLRTDPYSGERYWESIGGGDGYGARIDDRTGTVFIHENYSMSRYDPFTQRKVREVSKKFNGDRTLDDLRPIDPVSGEKAWIPNTFRMMNHPLSGHMIWGMTELYERVDANFQDVDVKPGEIWTLLTDAGKLEPAQWKRRIWEFDICASEPDVLYLAWSGLPEFGLPAGLFRTVPEGCDEAMLKQSGLRCVEQIPMERFPSQGLLGIDFPIITGVAAHPGNPDKVWVTFGGYQPEFKVWSWTRNASGNGGVWKDEGSESLRNLPVNGIVCEGGSRERLYIATDAGVYYTDKGMDGWKKLGNLPNVRCTELMIHRCSGTLRVATFGRGLWEGDLLPSEPSHEFLISDRQIWSSARSLDVPLRILDGGHLIIRAPIGIPAGGQVIVEPGGTLTLEGEGGLQNYCGKPWAGVSPVTNRTFWQWLLGKKAIIEGIAWR